MPPIDLAIAHNRCKCRQDSLACKARISRQMRTRKHCRHELPPEEFGLAEKASRALARPAERRPNHPKTPPRPTRPAPGTDTPPATTPSDHPLNRQAAAAPSHRPANPVPVPSPRTTTLPVRCARRVGPQRQHRRDRNTSPLTNSATPTPPRWSTPASPNRRSWPCRDTPQPR